MLFVPKIIGSTLCVLVVIGATRDGKIGFVTPVQKHAGLDIGIIKKRKDGATEAKKNRLEQNRKAKIQKEVDKLVVEV